MPPSRRYGSGAYALHHAHLAMLLGEAAPDGDAAHAADVLLAALSAGLYQYQRRARRLSVRRIKEGVDRVLEGLLRGA